MMQFPPVQFGRTATPQEAEKIRSLAQNHYGRDQAERLDVDYCFVQDRVAMPDPEQFQAEAMSDFSRICETLNRKGVPKTDQPVFAIIKFPDAAKAEQNLAMAHKYNETTGVTDERKESSLRIQDWIKDILKGFDPARDFMKMARLIQAMETRRQDNDVVQTGPDNTYVLYRMVIPADPSST